MTGKLLCLSVLQGHPNHMRSKSQRHSATRCLDCLKLQDSAKRLRRWLLTVCEEKQAEQCSQLEAIGMQSVLLRQNGWLRQAHVHFLE